MEAKALMTFLLDLFMYGPDNGNNVGGGTTADDDEQLDPRLTTNSDQDDVTDDDHVSSSATSTTTVGKRTTGTEFEDVFKRFLAKHGDAEQAAEVLFRDNYDLRDGNRTLRSEIADLRAKTPQRGAMILNRTEVETYKALRALGPTPAMIAKELEIGRNAVAELAKRRKDDTLREVAEVANLNFKTLKSTEVGTHDFVLKEAEQDGRKVRQAFVRVKDGEATKEIPVTDFITNNYDFLLPALQVGGANGANGGGSGYGNSSNGVNRQANSRMVRQPGPSGQQQQDKGAASKTVMGVYGTNIPGTTKTKA